MNFPTLEDFRKNQLRGDTEAVYLMGGTDAAYAAGVQQIQEKFPDTYSVSTNYPIVFSVNFKEDLDEDEDDPAIAIVAPDIGLDFSSYDINDFQKAVDLLDSTITQKNVQILGNSFFMK